MGIVGELFCLEREGMVLTMDARGTPAGKVKAPGKLVVTTVRMCFVADAPTAAFQALDIPFQGLTGEAFKQPVFGANYLEGQVAPVPGRGLNGTTSFTLAFHRGGCQTFLRVFFALMDQYRRRDAAARAAWMAPPAVQTFLAEQAAYVDPSDPSRVFVAQPQAWAPAPQPAPQGWPGVAPAAPTGGPSYAAGPGMPGTGGAAGYGYGSDPSAAYPDGVPPDARGAARGAGGYSYAPVPTTDAAAGGAGAGPMSAPGARPAAGGGYPTVQKGYLTLAHMPLPR